MAAPALSRPRFALLVMLGAYPLITILLTLWGPLISGRPPWQTGALIVPQMVIGMIWLVIPAVHRWFGWFILRR